MGYVNDSFIFITYRQHASLGPAAVILFVRGQTLNAVIVLTVCILVI